MTEAELSKFLDDNKDAIMSATRNAIIERIQEQVKWSLPDTIQTTVATFLKDEIAPEVAKALAEQRGPIIAAAKKAAVALGNTLAEKFTEQAVKSMDGYRTEAVFKALLGVKDRY